MCKEMLRGWIACVCVLVLVTVAGTADAGVMSVRLQVTDANIGVGETTVLQVLAFADDPAATGNNGLNSWDMYLDIDPSEDGIVMVDTDGMGDPLISYIAPTPYLIADCAGFNGPVTGEVSLMGVSTFGAQDSPTGVGDYHLLAEVTIVGTAEGTVQYAPTGPVFHGALRDGQQLDGEFDAAGSSSIINVIPEPVSVMLVAMAGGMVVCRRKR